VARKRARLESPFRKTESRGLDTVPAEGRTFSIGIGLKESEIQMVDNVASQLGVSRNQVLRYPLNWE